MKNTLLIVLSVFFLGSNFATAQEIDSLFSELRKEKHYKNQAKILLDISEIYRYAGDFTKSDSCIQIAIEKCDANNDIEKKGECYNYLGINASFMGDFKKSYHYFEKYLNISFQIGDSAAIARGYENLGIILKSESKYKEAIEMQLKALKIREKFKNNNRLASSYMNIGVLFGKIKNREKRGYYLKKALKTAKSNPKTSLDQFASIYIEMGNFFDNKTQTDSSLYYYNLSYKYSEKINWLQGKAVALGNIANVYYEIEDYKNALKTINKSVIISKLSKDILSLTSDLKYKAGIYFKLDSIKKAEKSCKNAYDIAIENDFYDELEDINKLFYEIYEKKGDYKKALEYYIKHKEISDSLYSKNKMEYMHNLEQKYQTELKEQKIIALSAKNKNRNIQLIATIIVFILLLGIIISLIFAKRRKQEIQLNTLRQKLFRAQLNPHFLFNALGSIQNFMHNNDAKKATFYLGSFSSLMRSILNNSQKELITLDDEIQTLKNYTDLENMRLKKAFNFNIETDENLETEFVLLPPMLLQPFIENAIKHGFSDGIENPKLVLKFSEKNNILYISVEDNGIGINHKKDIESNQKTHESFALKVFEERLKAIRGKLKKSIKYDIVDLSEINNMQHGTKVNIQLPLTYAQ